MRRIFIIISLLALMNCSKDSMMANAIKLPYEGSYALVQGAKDGCYTAHSSRGNSFYRTFFNFTQDPNMILDDEYADSWYRGYIYCFHIVNLRAFTPIDDNGLDHTWFWNKDQPGNPAVFDWPIDAGIPMIGEGEGIKVPGQGEEWWDSLFGVCKGIWQCANK
jgi:hypothetical protein